MDYETLDKIADAYIPFLAMVFFVGLGIRTAKRRDEMQFLLRVLVFFVGMLFVSYGMMFIDNAIHLWPAFGLDYSTHTAVSLAFIMSISVFARQFLMVLISSFFAYVLLMLYQKYHTIFDIVSTMVPIVVAALLFVKLLLLQAKDKQSSNSQS